jgi:hypothetical protein
MGDTLPTESRRRLDGWFDERLDVRQWSAAALLVLGARSTPARIVSRRRPDDPSTVGQFIVPDVGISKTIEHAAVRPGGNRDAPTMGAQHPLDQVAVGVRVLADEVPAPSHGVVELAAVPDLDPAVAYRRSAQKIV